MLELWKEALDKGYSVAGIFMDLPKAFNTLNHDLLIAELGAYGFSENSYNYIQSYAIVYKGQMRIIISVYEKIFFLVFHKDLYSAP